MKQFRVLSYLEAARAPCLALSLELALCWTRVCRSATARLWSREGGDSVSCGAWGLGGGAGGRDGRAGGQEGLGARAAGGRSPWTRFEGLIFSVRRGRKTRRTGRRPWTCTWTGAARIMEGVPVRGACSGQCLHADPHGHTGGRTGGEWVWASRTGWERARKSASKPGRCRVPRLDGEGTEAGKAGESEERASTWDSQAERLEFNQCCCL